MAFGKFVDMAITPKERKESAAYAMPTVGNMDQPIYPYGLTGCLCDDELEKLGLETPEVGDVLDARCLLRVTSVSQNETTDGKRTRVEYQTIMMAVEDEDEEEEEMPRKPRSLMSSYKKG